MPNKGKNTVEEKIRIVELYLSGEVGFSEAGKEAGVDHKTIARWVSRYKTEGPAGFLPQGHDRATARKQNCRRFWSIWPGKGLFRRYVKNIGSGIPGSSDIG